MIALWILLLPAIGALLAWAVGRLVPGAARFVAASVLLIDATLLGAFWAQQGGDAAPGSIWLAEWSASWIPQLGIRFSLGLDGLALLMSLMACAAGAAALLGYPGDRADEGAHSALLLATITGVLGVFLSTDLMLFFMFYEVMLVPAYVLIIRWGSGDRQRAAMRFFVFTQAGGLLMLISIVGLHVTHLSETGEHSFDYAALIDTPMTGPIEMLLLLGFVLAFAVKLPMVPFHTWQPQAYACAPTETSILLSALMAKTAGFGLLRFAIPLFPDAAERLAPWALATGVVTVLYASWLAYGQRDLKRAIAYSSAGHLGYVVLGAFALNDLARSGAVLQMFCHGLSVAGLFLVAGHIERRAGTRDLDALGGLWGVAPRMGGIGLVFLLATLGLPGLGNFVGEFLILAGVFQEYPAIGAIAAAGAVVSAAYSLRMMQRIFFGPRDAGIKIADLPARTLAVCGALIAALMWTGLRPGTLLDAVNPPASTQELDSGDPR